MIHRNALRLAREAEETARGTIAKLGDQSGKLTKPFCAIKDELTNGRTNRQL